MIGDSGIGLLLRLKADNRQAKQQIKEVKDEKDALEKDSSGSGKSFLSGLGERLAGIGFGKAKADADSLGSSVDGLGGKFAALGGPVGAGVGAIVGGATAALTAVTALGVGLFKLTAQAAETGTEIKTSRH